MSKYDMNLTPEVDSVDVLVLGYNKGEKLILPISDRFDIHSTTHISEKRVVNAIGDLWRNLAPGEQDRCHIPPYGLRFHQGDTKILEASICWECNNILITLPDGAAGYSFDGKSESAQKLLRLLRYLSGEYLKHNPGTALSLDDYL